MEVNLPDLADMERWLDQLDERLAAGQALDAADPVTVETPDGFDLSDNMDGTWVEESDEHLNIGQETPHGFDLATAIAAPDQPQQIVFLPQQPFLNLDLEAMINVLQPWFCDCSLTSPFNRPLLPDVGCDVKIILDLEPLSPHWRQMMIISRHYTALRVIRKRWGRTLQQRLDDAQQEIYACGSWLRLSLGPFWEPPFDCIHPMNGQFMCMGTIKLTHSAILHYVADGDRGVYRKTLRAAETHIVARIESNQYGDASSFASTNYLQNPPILPDLHNNPYGSCAYGDTISALFLGDTNTSTKGHWMGFHSQHPKIPIHVQANAAILLTWAVHKAASKFDNIPVPSIESINADAHIALLVHLWSSPDTFVHMARLEDKWLSRGGRFHD